MDEFSRIVEKQIAWNYREHFVKGCGDDGGRSASERAGGALPTACSAEEVSFVIGHFFAVSPRRPRREDFVVGVHAKNWILCSFHLYSVFSACGPLGCSYRVQNEWVKLLFKDWTFGVCDGTKSESASSSDGTSLSVVSSRYRFRWISLK